MLTRIVGGPWHGRLVDVDPQLDTLRLPKSGEISPVAVRKIAAMSPSISRGLDIYVRRGCFSGYASLCRPRGQCDPWLLECLETRGAGYYVYAHADSVCGDPEPEIVCRMDVCECVLMDPLMALIEVCCRYRSRAIS